MFKILSKASKASAFSWI